MTTHDDRGESATDHQTHTPPGSPLRHIAEIGPLPIAAGADADLVLLPRHDGRAIDLLVTVAGGPRGRTAWIYPAIDGAEHEGWPVYGEPAEQPALAGLKRIVTLPGTHAELPDLLALDGETLVHLHAAQGQRHVLGTLESFGIPGSGRVVQLVAQDWDGDGRVDLLVTIDDLEGYWPPDAELPHEQLHGVDQDGLPLGLDDHGHWRGKPARGRIFWLRNTGDPGSPRLDPAEEIAPEAGSRVKVGLHPACFAIAWGVRGSAELMLTDHTGVLRLHRNFGGQLPPVMLEPRPLDLDGKPLHLPAERNVILPCDLPGAEASRLLFSEFGGRLFGIRCGKGRDKAQRPEPLRHAATTLRLGGGAVFTGADLDGDGDVDIVAGDASGRLWYIEDLGTPADHRYAAPLEIEAGGTPWKLGLGRAGTMEGPAALSLGYACPTIADWKHADRPDLVLGGTAGEVWYLRNNGGPTQPRWGEPECVRYGRLPLITPPRVRPAVAHWQEEGVMPDLLSLDCQGLLCVYPRESDLEVGPPRPLLDPTGRVIRLDGGFAHAGGCSLWVGPWTRSGRQDILVGLPAANRWLVPGLTGASFASGDDLHTVLLLVNLGDDVVSPRALRLADGRPLAIAGGGCSPFGAAWRGADQPLDLLVGADDGQVRYYPRESLRW